MDENMTGPLVAFGSDSSGPFEQILLDSVRDTQPSFAKQISRMGLMFELVKEGRLKFRQIKFIDDDLELITDQYTLYDADFPAVSEIFQIGTIDNSKDSPPNYCYRPGRLFGSRSGGLILESYPPIHLHTAPISMIKTQREFGLTAQGDIIQFSDQSHTYNMYGLTVGKKGRVTDFAVCQAANDDQRLLAVIVDSLLSLVTFSIQQGPMTAITVEHISQPAIAVYSHWNIPYIFLLPPEGDKVLVFDIRSRSFIDSLTLGPVLWERYLALSQPGSFPITKEGFLDKDGKVLVAAYTTNQAYIFRLFDPPRWEKVGNYFSLTAPANVGHEFMYGLKC